MSPYLGVDGGNSKAVAVVATATGDVLAAARKLGTADIYTSGGEQAAIELVARAIDEALALAGTYRSEVGRSVFSLAGADWPEDFAYHAQAWREMGFSHPVAVVNDAIGALAGAAPTGPAVVVSIGTGAATGARGVDGGVWHSSFWQSPHGAAELAQRAFDAVVRAELGIGPTTALRDPLLAVTGDPDVEAALHRFTARGAGPLPVGPIVRALLVAARDGDVAARHIVEEHGRGLGEVAAAAARRVSIGAEPFAVSFTGGLARADDTTLLGAAAVGLMASEGLKPVLVPPRWEPALGALVIGLQADGNFSENVAARLDATRPPPSLYDVLSP